MTQLTRYLDTPPYSGVETIQDYGAITTALAPIGIRLERWDTPTILNDEMTDIAILAAYAKEIDHLQTTGGYSSCDVMRLTADHPQRVEMRTKFLSEHIHDDDEVRFFVEGSALFYFRGSASIYALECCAGDLIVLPGGTRHWFDMGERPFFTVIRLFTTPDGWVARFTGDPISEAIPLYAGPL